MTIKKGYYFVAITGILSGTIIFGGAIFADLGLSSFEISVFRAMFALLLLPYILYKKEYTLDKRQLKTLLSFGFIVSLALLLEFAPVVMGVPVAITVLLLYTAPLWTVIFSKFLFKEAITKEKVIAIILVLIGIIILTNPLNSASHVNFAGFLIALVGGIFLSLWGVYGKICGNINSHPAKTQFYETLFALFFLSLLYPLLSAFVKNPALVSFSFNHPAEIWGYLFIFSIISLIIPHLFYYQGVKDIPASTAGIILLLEPVSGAILAALFLAQAITLNILIGGAFIILANYLVIKAETSVELEPH